MTRDVENRCGHERAHIGDSHFHGGGYSRPISRQIFCDVCRLQRWVDIEAALASSQADLGLIPFKAAERINAAADVSTFDLEAVRDGIVKTGHSLVPLLRQMEIKCGGYAAQFLHHGATTQDIQDTGMVLEMRDVLDIIADELGVVLHALAALARDHRDHLITGRTHGRPALPMTFGLKVAGWADELLRQRARFHEARPRILVAQLFGGVGTMAAFGERGFELLERFATRLGLGVPRTSWHVARDRVAEYVQLMAMLTGTMARIADEVRVLSAPEIGEVEEHWNAEQVSSSTMPHKRNPEISEQIVVLARLTRAQVSLGLEAMILEHERDYRGTRLEWPAVADASHYTLTALGLLSRILEGLDVDVERMANAALARADELCTEAMMLALASFVGKQRAFELVRALCQRARDADVRVVDAFIADSEIAAVMSEAVIRRTLDPRSHLGKSGQLVDAVVETIAADATVCAKPRPRARTPP